MKKINHDDFLPELPICSPLNITRSRKKIYVTQLVAAKLCRVKVQTWRNWESGKYFMPEVAWAYWLIQQEKVRKALEENYHYLKKAAL